MKKDFYIFLDIDGVLWDVEYILKEIDEGHIKKGGIIKDLKPSCIEALNYLIEKLENFYDVILVISSSWRYNLKNTINILKKYGLKYDKDIARTRLTTKNSSRGEEILDYLKDKSNYEFVIIDDEEFDFKKHFDKSNIIKTNIENQSLSMKMVREYLSSQINKKNNRS